MLCKRFLLHMHMNGINKTYPVLSSHEHETRMTLHDSLVMAITFLHAQIAQTTKQSRQENAAALILPLLSRREPRLPQQKHRQIHLRILEAPCICFRMESDPLIRFCKVTRK